MFVPQIPLLLLFWEKKFTTRGPSTSTLHRYVRFLPIAKNSPLLPPMRAPPQTDPSFCSSAYEVLAVVSSYCSPPKGRFLRVTHPSDLHVLSMSPAFILSQDRTLHEIHSCITYSFLFVDKANSKLSCIYALHIRLEFTLRNIVIPTPSLNPTSLLFILI
ncbi:hypothetical protein Gotur_013927 [Gossypium turneri]